MPGEWGSNAHDQTGGADLPITPNPSLRSPTPPDLYVRSSQSPSTLMSTSFAWPTPSPLDVYTLRFDPTSPGRMSAVLCYDDARSAVSSNGRTLDSESSSWGSNPCTAATPLPLRTAWLRFTIYFCMICVAGGSDAGTIPLAALPNPA